MKNQNSTIRTVSKFVAIGAGLGGLMLTVGLAHAGIGISPEALTSILDWSGFFADGMHGGYDAAGVIIGY